MVEERIANASFCIPAMIHRIREKSTKVARDELHHGAPQTCTCDTSQGTTAVHRLAITVSHHQHMPNRQSIYLGQSKLDNGNLCKPRRRYHSTRYELLLNPFGMSPGDSSSPHPTPFFPATHLRQTCRGFPFARRGAPKGNIRHRSMFPHALGVALKCSEMSDEKYLSLMGQHPRYSACLQTTAMIL